MGQAWAWDSDLWAARSYNDRSAHELSPESDAYGWAVSQVATFKRCQQQSKAVSSWHRHLGKSHCLHVNFSTMMVMALSAGPGSQVLPRLIVHMLALPWSPPSHSRSYWRCNASIVWSQRQRGCHWDSSIAMIIYIRNVTNVLYIYILYIQTIRATLYRLYGACSGSPQIPHLKPWIYWVKVSGHYVDCNTWPRKHECQCFTGWVKETSWGEHALNITGMDQPFQI